MSEPGKLVPAALVAKELGLDVRTVRAWIRKRRVGGVRIPKGEAKRAGYYMHRSAFEKLQRERG